MHVCIVVRIGDSEYLCDVPCELRQPQLRKPKRALNYSQIIWQIVFPTSRCAALSVAQGKVTKPGCLAVASNKTFLIFVFSTY